MLADQAFCDMVHSIGVASLCADDKQIWHLTKIYWFTVEFGVVEEGDEIKAFGAGVFARLGTLPHLPTVAQSASTSHVPLARGHQVLSSRDRVCSSSLSATFAGILSSFGEMEHMHTGRAKLLPFDPEAKQPKMSYKVKLGI